MTSKLNLNFPWFPSPAPWFWSDTAFHFSRSRVAPKVTENLRFSSENSYTNEVVDGARYKTRVFIRIYMQVRTTSVIIKCLYTSNVTALYTKRRCRSRTLRDAHRHAPTTTISNHAIPGAATLQLRAPNAIYHRLPMNMETTAEPSKTNTSPAHLDPIVRSYLASIGARGGHATKNNGSLKLAATRNAARTWRLRRARYGPTGRRQPWQIRAARMQAAMGTRRGELIDGPEPAAPFGEHSSHCS